MNNAIEEVIAYFSIKDISVYGLWGAVKLIDLIYNENMYSFHV